MAKTNGMVKLYRWHAWAGLLGGLFLIVICTTGTVAVFRPEIERAVDLRDVNLDVTPAGNPVGVDEAVATAERAFAGRRASAVRFPAIPGSAQPHGDTYQVTIEGTKGSSGALAVYVDPYRNVVIGSVIPSKGWGDFVRQLHVRFYYGSFWGRYIVGGFGLVLLFSTVSGLLIFRRFNGGRWWVSVRWGRPPRVVLGDLHKVVGLWTVVFNILFGVTGAVLGLEGVYFKYIQTKPPAVARAEAMKRIDDGQIARWAAQAESLVRGGKATGIGLTYRRNGLVRVSISHPTAKLIKEDASYVVLEAATGRVAEVYDASKTSAGLRMYYATEPLHFGRLGGYLWVKVLWGLVGLSAGMLSIGGFAIYALRKRVTRTKGANVTPLPAEAVAA